jgi:uncharacterized NAD(P)/FAD-binding protein YdhS
MTQAEPDSLAIGIIGGGASGVLAARALARTCPGARLHLIDAEPGRGVAYGGREPAHLLNTRAINMSLDKAEPRGFLDWLARRRPLGRDWDAQDFVPRMVFGDYLAEALAELVGGPACLRLILDQAVGVRHGRDRWRVGLRRGGELDFDILVLAMGNAPPRPLAFPGREAVEAFVLDNPWQGPAIEAIPPNGETLLVGTGLTAVDAAVSLLGRPHGPRVMAVSRRGLLPRVHDRPHAELPALAPPYPDTARGLYRRVRGLAETVGGSDARRRHSVFLGLKPAIPAIWAGLPAAEKRRFLRHLRAWWEVERHRLAPEIAAILEDGRRIDRFRTGRGRIVGCTPLADGSGVMVELASGERRWSMTANRIVNCTGPDQDLSRSTDPLVRDLLAQGVALDEVRLGFQVDAAGAAGPGLFAVGSLTRGSFFEITAVPEIRDQAERMAQAIAARAMAPA